MNKNGEGYVDPTPESLPRLGIFVEKNIKKADRLSVMRQSHTDYEEYC